MQPDRGRCPWCARPRPLDTRGRLAAHTVTIPVSRSAIHTVGASQVRRRCSGSGQPPRSMQEGTR